MVGNEILEDMVDYISAFKTDEEFKETYKSKINNLLDLYNCYDPNIEIQEQLSCMGRVRLVAIKEIFKEENREINIDPINLKELNMLIGSLIVMADKYTEYKYKTNEEGILELVQEYVSVLCTYKKYLDSLNEKE